MIQGSLEVKLPTTWADRKAKVGRVREEKRRREKIREESTPLWREAKPISKSKCTKTHHARTTFGSCDVEKVHAVVARSTFPSQNAQKKFSVGALLEVEMSKKCTPLWGKARFEVKRCQKWKKLRCSEHFWTFGCRFAWQAQGVLHLAKGEQNVRVLTTTATTLYDITLHYTPIQLQLQLHYITLQYTNYTTLHSHSTSLHSITRNYATLQLNYNYTTLHYITLHRTLQLQLQVQLQLPLR